MRAVGRNGAPLALVLCAVSVTSAAQEAPPVVFAPPVGVGAAAPVRARVPRAPRMELAVLCAYRALAAADGCGGYAGAAVGGDRVTVRGWQWLGRTMGSPHRVSVAAGLDVHSVLVDNRSGGPGWSAGVRLTAQPKSRGAPLGGTAWPYTALGFGVFALAGRAELGMRWGAGGQRWIAWRASLLHESTGGITWFLQAVGDHLVAPGSGRSGVLAGGGLWFPGERRAVYLQFLAHMGQPGAVVAVGWRASLRRPDADRDGIPDRVDACPHIPEDRDGFADDDGCLDPDDDEDGFPDAEDACPRTPADAWSQDGC